MSKLARTNQEGNWVAVKFKKGESGFLSERVFLQFLSPPPEVMAGVFISWDLHPRANQSSPHGGGKFTILPTPFTNYEHESTFDLF